MNLLVDSHCHLDFPDFEAERDEVVARAREAGVGWILTIGTRATTFGGVMAIAEHFENVFCSVGIHPHEAGREPALTAEQLVRMAARSPKVVGFGEAGLDYYYDHSTREDQKRVFRIHATAARETQLPLIVHTRDADEDTLRILCEEQAAGCFPGVIHCFSTGRQLAEKAVEIGMYISLSGILTFPRAEALREVVRDLPLDRLLVETDSPYLAPVPRRGKRNEPAFVAHTAARLAEIKGISPDELARVTTQNFFRLFAKASPGETAR